MRRTALALSLASALCVSAQAAHAQLAIGARAGTTGVGGELTFGLTDKIAVRGTATVIPMKPKFKAGDAANSIEYEAELPSPIFTAGADLSLAGPFRLFGGLMIGADKVAAGGDYTQSVTFGDRTYTGSGRVTATVETSSTAPFLGIGFGKTWGTGIGLNLDLGGALLGESTVTLDATGPVRSASDYEAQRQKEQQKIQDKVDKYAKVYPMISLGIRVGLGN
jgi:hypothetical protein